VTASSGKDTVQKAVVRVIASELDRRSGPLERAITDVAAHVQAVSAEHDGALAELRRQVSGLQQQLADIQQTQQRILPLLDELAARMRAREADAELVDSAVRGLQSELLDVQGALARHVVAPPGP
jgi:chromosome segregation ATPase